MKKLIILSMQLMILFQISTQENKLMFLERNAYNKMTDNERYALITKLISEYNNMIDTYRKQNIEYETVISEIEKKLKNEKIEKEKIKKENKHNQFQFFFGYGLNTKFENNILFQFSYTRKFFQNFGLGLSTSYNYNVENIHTIYISINTSIFF